MDELFEMASRFLAMEEKLKESLGRESSLITKQADADREVIKKATEVWMTVAGACEEAEAHFGYLWDLGALTSKEAEVIGKLRLAMSYVRGKE